MISEKDIEALKDELIEMGVDGPNESCCRQWKPIDELIRTLLRSDKFNELYMLRPVVE